MRKTFTVLLMPLVALAGCTHPLGRPPEFKPVEGTPEHATAYALPLPLTARQDGPGQGSSLWTADTGSLLGDRRAARRGDILTVVIEIDDSAEISNSSGRSRSASDKVGIPSLFGIPQRVDRNLPEGASLSDAVDASSSASYQGEGSVARNERLTLRVAATVVEELPNGVLRIQGSQEVRVNFELRELLVSGFVRPADITRQNEISYDRIAGARISYGGRGQITDVQQPRWGQQVADTILPY